MSNEKNQNKLENNAENKTVHNTTKAKSGRNMVVNISTEGSMPKISNYTTANITTTEDGVTIITEGSLPDVSNDTTKKTTYHIGRNMVVNITTEESSSNASKDTTKPAFGGTDKPEKHDKAMVDADLQKNITSAPQKQQIMFYSLKNTGQTHAAGGAATMPIMPGGSGYWNYVVVGAFDDMLSLPAKAWHLAAPKIASGFKTLKGALVLDGPANGFNMSDVVVMMAIDNNYALGSAIKNGQTRRYAGDIIGFFSGAVTMYAETLYRYGGGDMVKQGFKYHQLRAWVARQGSLNRQLIGNYAKVASGMYITAKVMGVEGSKAAITYTAVKTGVAAKTVGAPVAIFYVAALGPQFFQSKFSATEIIDGQEVPMQQSIDWTKPLTNPLGIRQIYKAIKGEKVDQSMSLKEDRQERNDRINLVKQGLQHRCYTIENNTPALYFSNDKKTIPAFGAFKDDKVAVKTLIGQ